MDRPVPEPFALAQFPRRSGSRLSPTVGRSWVKAAPRPSSVWYRAVAYNFVLIMCNTGMRPPEAKNLRWRDISVRKDREGRDVAVLRVRGKGKTRELVAPGSVAQYLDRIRAIAQAKEPDDRVFTTSTGEPVKELYKALVAKPVNRSHGTLIPGTRPAATASLPRPLPSSVISRTPTSNVK